LKKEDLIKINNYLWEIPQSFRKDMRVPGRVYATEKMLSQILLDRSLEQLVNLTTLPLIMKYVLAMPDIHEGYGAPIGGVGATLMPEGAISPGFCGYDINCGVRLLKTFLKEEEIKSKIDNLAEEIFKTIPSGLGKGGGFKLEGRKMDQVLEEGMVFLEKEGYASSKDLEHCESYGRLEMADAAKVSFLAKARGKDQLGTLGSGNHFLEIQKVDFLDDKELAENLGLKEGDITILIHTGSRGLGHQVATDYLKNFLRAMGRYKIDIPDKELACVPFNSPEGRSYFSAMAAAANFAWSNRQIITYFIRQTWKKFFKTDKLPELVYDVAHNIIKIEKNSFPEEREVLVHRKGATRAFPAGHEELPEDYKKIGQPVIIPGSMGTSSYVLIGQPSAMTEAFGSSCHGSGRQMSRHEAVKKASGKEIKETLKASGVIIKTNSISSLSEEAPYAYKDIEEIIEVISQTGIAKKVVRLKPLAVIKG